MWFVDKHAPDYADHLPEDKVSRGRALEPAADADAGSSVGGGSLAHQARHARAAGTGAVGSLAGQIPKIKGCREMGFDAAFNYKGKNTEQLSREIAALCPNGVDIFFNNVGGEILDAALLNLAMFARIAFCGAICAYTKTGPIPGPCNYWQILARCATDKTFDAGIKLFVCKHLYFDAQQSLFTRKSKQVGLAQRKPTLN